MRKQVGVDAQLFVVHVWHQEARFRASVRRVDGDQTLVFHTPTQLARYLSGATSTPAASAQPDPASVAERASGPATNCTDDGGSREND